MKIYDLYGYEIDSTITPTEIINPEDGKTIEANFIDKISTDECFEYNNVTNDCDFYQYAEINGKIYRLYFEQTEDGELDNIDYTRPLWIEEEKFYTLENNPAGRA